MSRLHILRAGGVVQWRLSLYLQAYDSHCNLVLGEVEETLYVVDEDEDNDEDNVRTVKKQSEMLFVRGRPSQYRASTNSPLTSLQGTLWF